MKDKINGKIESMKHLEPIELRSLMDHLIGKIVVYMILFLFPVILDHKLYNLTQTRYRMFLIVSFGGLGFMILNHIRYLVVCRRLSYKHSMKMKSFQKFLQSVPVSMWFISIFAVVSVITFLVSPFKAVVLSGIASRYTGLYFMLGIVSLYITVTRCYILNQMDIAIAMFVGFWINLLAVINFCGIDLFGFFQNIAESQEDNFISTLGNVDVYGAYAVITTVICLYLLLKEEKMWMQVAYFIFAFIGCMGTIVSGSDASFAGLVTFVLLLIIVSSDSLPHLSDCGIVVLIFCSAFIAVRCLNMILINRCRTINGIYAFLYDKLRYPIFGLIILAVIGIKCLAFRYESPFKRVIVRGIRILLIIGIMAAACGLCTYMVYVSKNVATVKFNNINIYFKFQDSWGSGRGYIWHNLIDGYHNMPLLYQIFGTGQGTISSVLSHYASIHWNLYDHQVIDNAHNILLQFLITMGVTGCLSYLMLVGYGCSRVLIHLRRIAGLDQSVQEDTRKQMVMLLDQKSEYVYCAIGFAVCAYFVQGMFCILETITFPIFICLLAMLNSKHKN